jgi:predicted ATP-dependent endonuclease of OLD family
MFALPARHQDQATEKAAIMIIDSIHVTHFRSLLDQALRCGEMTALVGANGSGKSCFLRAFDLFYSLAPRVGIEDFYAEDPSTEIAVAITFAALSEEAKTLFASYIQGDTLTVERVFTWDNGKVKATFHGSSLQNPGFTTIRGAASATDKKTAYEALRQKTDYATLPKWKNQNDASTAMKDWETANANRCVRQRDDGQFFGFQEVGKGYLGKFTRFLFVPAVRDASADATEAKGSVFATLMDLVVRSVIANKEGLKQLKASTQQAYRELMDPAKLTELGSLATELTSTLKTFAPEAGIELRWLPIEELDIAPPRADIRIIEDGYSSAVNRAGHGLQRAFILTMLQQLAKAQTVGGTQTITGGPADAGSRLPNLVLSIEEPELYQHPNRQRHLARILLQLATGKTPGVAERTQVIYCTHSPFFVGIDRINNIRLLRKVTHTEHKPKVTKLVSTTLSEVAETIWKADSARGNQFSDSTLIPRLHTIMTPWMNEGFFADVVVLVEGEDDRAIILGAARAMGQELESRGVSVIPCGGKSTMDRPAAIFRHLGIPVYLIWDGDEGKDADPEENHRLLRLLGQPIVDWPAEIHDRFSCFKTDLETTLQEEIGKPVFEKLLLQHQKQFGMSKRKHAIKNPAVIASVLQVAQSEGKSSSTINAIVQKILALP